MAESGWIKMHRMVCDHWVWDCEFSYGQAWVDLLLKASHKPVKLTIKGQLLELERGQQARSEVTLAKEWRWSRGKVRRYLKLLVNDCMISIKAVHLTSIITICNYDGFQVRDTADGTADDTANGQLTVHKQEVKKLRTREIKEKDTDKDLVADAPKNPAPQFDWSSLLLSSEQVQDVKAIRAKHGKKGKISQRVINTLAGDFAELRDFGFTDEQIISEWDTRGWVTVKAAWMIREAKEAARMGGHQPGKKQGPTHALSGITYQDQDL